MSLAFWITFILTMLAWAALTALLIRLHWESARKHDWPVYAALLFWPIMVPLFFAYDALVWIRRKVRGR